MHIVCFLHSNADTGEYLGFEGLNDIFEFVGTDLESINHYLNDEIKGCIDKDTWEEVKDSVFRIDLQVIDGKPYPSCIEQMRPVFRA